MTITVFSLSFDNALFNQRYLADCAQNPQPASLIATRKTALFRANRDFFLHLAKQCQNSQDVVIMNASARQSFQLDRHYSAINQSGCCLTHLNTVTQALDKLLPKLKPRLDGLLLADLYNDAYGTGQTLNEFYDIQRQPYQQAHSLQDSSFFSQLYAQLHHVALKTPNTPINFSFFLADSKTLQTLQDFLAKAPELIPTNVTLTLTHYQGEQVQALLPLKGTGEIDAHYFQTTKQMAERYLQAENYHPQTLFLALEPQQQIINTLETLSPQNIHQDTLLNPSQTPCVDSYLSQLGRAYGPPAASRQIWQEVKKQKYQRVPTFMPLLETSLKLSIDSLSNTATNVFLRAKESKKRQLQIDSLNLIRALSPPYSEQPEDKNAAIQDAFKALVITACTQRNGLKLNWMRFWGGRRYSSYTHSASALIKALSDSQQDTQALSALTSALGFEHGDEKSIRMYFEQILMKHESQQRLNSSDAASRRPPEPPGTGGSMSA